MDIDESNFENESVDLIMNKRPTCNVTKSEFVICIVPDVQYIKVGIHKLGTLHSMGMMVIKEPAMNVQ